MTEQDLADYACAGLARRPLCRQSHVDWGSDGPWRWVHLDLGWGVPGERPLWAPLWGPGRWLIGVRLYRRSVMVNVQRRSV